MSDHDAGEPDHRLPMLLKKAGYAYAYWATFLLVLEPGNVLRADRAGHGLGFPHETARILAAAALGAAATPLLVALVRRYPLSGRDRWRRGLIHAGSSVVLAAALIVLSCLFASWMFEGRVWPTLMDVRDQLLGNWLLLSFALLACTALLHIAGGTPERKKRMGPERARPRRFVRVSTRGRVQFVRLANVDWIETQGNYLALHVGTESHLIRETADRIVAELDPNRFVRIHRRAIVAVDRIASIERVANGDARVTLSSGHEIRASRRYRKELWERWGGPRGVSAAPTSPR